MMIHHYNCLLVIIIPCVMDVHMMLKRGKSNAKNEFGQLNVAKEGLDIILTFC